MTKQIHNPKPKSDDVDRRGWLRFALRSSALAGLTVLSVGLWRRSRVAACPAESAGQSSGESAASSGHCSRCGELPRCGLPLAVSHRKRNGD